MSAETSDYDLGRAIFGWADLDVSGDGSSAYVAYGTALTDSADGSVTVDLDGMVEAGGTGIDLPTTVDVRKGDRVIVTIVDHQPTVTGVIGGGDRTAGEVTLSKQLSDMAAKDALAAKQAADYTKQLYDEVMKDVEASQKEIDDAVAKLEDIQPELDQAKQDVADARKAAADATEQAKLAKTTADGKNRVFVQTGEPAHDGLAKGDLWRRLDDKGNIVAEMVWDGTKFAKHDITANSVLVPSSVGAVLIADGAVSADKLAASSVTADKVVAQAITGDKIASNTVTTKNLVVSNFSNVIENGGFETGDLTGWSIWSGSFRVARADAAHGGSFVLTGGRTARLGANSAAFSVSEGESYMLSLWARVGSHAGDLKGTFSLEGTPKGGKNTRLGETSVPVNGWVWTQYATKVTVPAGYDSLHVNLDFAAAPSGQSENVQVDDVQVTRMADARLIVDGSVSTSKLTAGAVTAAKVNVADLSAALIRAGKLLAGNPSQAHLVLDGSGLRLYSTDGKTVTFNLTAGSGSIHMTGYIQQGSANFSDLGTVMFGDGSGLKIFRKVGSAVVSLVTKLTGDALSIFSKNEKVEIARLAANGGDFQMTSANDMFIRGAVTTSVGQSSEAGRTSVMGGRSIDIGAPASGSVWVKRHWFCPIYRLYNKYDKTYLFTYDANERYTLTKAGWTDQGIAFYAFEPKVS